MIHHLLSPREDLLLPILQTELCIPLDYSAWLLDLGSIYHNHKRAKSNISLKIGDYIRVHSQPRRFPIDRNWKDTIVHETDDFVIINKPFGVPTHPSVDNIIENAVHQLSLALNQPIYVTHRLDVATSGLLCLAKTKEFQKKFNVCLQEKTIEKKYRARVEGHLKQTGIIRHFMEVSTFLPKKLSVEPAEGCQECLLEIENVKHLLHDDGAPYSVVEIRLITGRTHQIRSQMAALGHPIIGDKIYGGQDPWEKIESIELISRYLKFKVGETFEFQLP
jgi:23S rRNA pseudouridine1911/1915/1917 synthase